ncbi:MAG: hypothetical protein KZQ93_12670 [Candidatus Thiodiazotropha sp. (ex Monitilora ramsayi)]|nr:hypothetical protein [Candidatus Thiodiazotropha sp. (ex Monitilora ramsayi)]
MENSTGIVNRVSILWIAVIILLFTIGTVNFFSAEDISISKLETLHLLTQLLIGAGVIFAVLTYLNSLQRQKAEEERNQSRVFLEYATKHFEMVVDLLKDKNNDRTTWIRSARILSYAQSLKYQIKTAEYRKAYDLEEFICRGELYKILSITNSLGKYQPLPASFFFGVDDWESKCVNQAALETAPKATSGSLNLSKNLGQPVTKRLSISSVVTILEFLKYGRDFRDPMERYDFSWGNDWMESRFSVEGAKRYSYFEEHYYIKDGKIFDRENNEITHTL